MLPLMRLQGKSEAIKERSSAVKSRMEREGYLIMKTTQKLNLETKFFLSDKLSASKIDPADLERKKTVTFFKNRFL